MIFLRSGRWYMDVIERKFSRDGRAKFINRIEKKMKKKFIG